MNGRLAYKPKVMVDNPATTKNSSVVAFLYFSSSFTNSPASAGITIRFHSKH